MEKEKKEWTLIYESKPPDVDKLYKAYALDKKKARVLFFNNRNNYSTTRVVFFKEKNGNFEIVHFVETLGISVTNKMYRRTKKIESVMHKGGKFYYITRTKKVTQLTYSGLRAFVGQFSSWRNIEDHAIIKGFIKKFSWIRFISEESLLHGIAFNSIIRYKLYSLNDALKHKFKAPIPVVKKIKILFKDYNNNDMMKIWKEMKQVLINVENLKPELFGSHLFIDTCKMARTLDKKVNCSWSLKRLKQEHDDWAKEITNTVLEFEVERELRVNKIFFQFAEITGYQILKTNKDLLREGMHQKHCVGTYIKKVDDGYSGIYHINGYTLELSFQKIIGVYNDDIRDYSRSMYQYLSIVQFRGKFNKDAPSELYKEVNNNVLSFNKGLAKVRGVNSDMEMLTMNKPFVNTFELDLEEVVRQDIVRNNEILPF
jgi:hypothetical protein